MKPGAGGGSIFGVRHCLAFKIKKHVYRKTFHRAYYYHPRRVSIIDNTFDYSYKFTKSTFVGWGLGNESPIISVLKII